MVEFPDSWKNPGRAVFFSAVILLIMMPCGVSHAAKISGRVVQVRDGETMIVLNKGRRVRVTLDGIEAPKGSDDFAEDATLVLSELVSQKQVRVRFEGKRNARKVRGTVFLPGQKGINSVNRSIVLAGLARATVAGPLANAQRQAERNKVGIFGDSLASKLAIPTAWIVVGSANTIPFEPGTDQARRVEILQTLSAAYAEIDRLTRGRELFVSNPTLGLGGAPEIARSTALELCANGQFRRQFQEFGAGFATNDFEEGNWEVRLDLTTLDGVTPLLVLNTTSGTDATNQPIPPNTKSAPLEPDTGAAGRIFIGDLSFASGPATNCPP